MEQKLLTNKDFTFIYNPHVMKYLRYEKNIPFICHGLSATTYKPFWMYQQTAQLDEALKEYKALNPHMKWK